MSGTETTAQPELTTTLSYLTGRELRPAEIFDALGISRSAYYLARAEGRLISADALLRLADAFGLNPLDLLVHYGFVRPDAIVGYIESRRADAMLVRPRGRSRRLQVRTDIPPL